MYSYIKGKIVQQASNYIVVDNSGVGYQIFVGNPFSFPINEECLVYTYSYIREDEYSLYGFKTIEEKELFLKLINVKGLGPKMALPIIATGSIAGIVDAIERENILYLKKFPKIGEKVARQIILDLKGKIHIDNYSSETQNFDELIDVLESLGYKNSEIKKILNEVDFSKQLEEQIKDALKLLLK